MQMTSELAQHWIAYCLLVISHTPTQSSLDHITDIAHTDIRMMFDTQLIDEDERAWSVQTVNDAIHQRSQELLQALKEPPKP